MTPDELEADIIRRVFDESFLNEKLLTKLLRAYVAACIAADRERCAAGLRNAAFTVRQDGGSELRAKTFEDAAYILVSALDT